MNRFKVLQNNYKTRKNKELNEIFKRQEREKQLLGVVSNIFLQITKEAEECGILLRTKEETGRIILYKGETKVIQFYIVYNMESYFFSGTSDYVIKESYSIVPTIDMAYRILEEDGDSLFKESK